MKFLNGMSTGQKVAAIIGWVFTALFGMAMAATKFIVHPFTGLVAWTDATRKDMCVSFGEIYNEGITSAAEKLHLFVGAGSGTDGAYVAADTDLLASTL